MRRNAPVGARSSSPRSRSARWSAATRRRASRSARWAPTSRRTCASKASMTFSAGHVVLRRRRATRRRAHRVPRGEGHLIQSLLSEKLATGPCAASSRRSSPALLVLAASCSRGSGDARHVLGCLPVMAVMMACHDLHGRGRGEAGEAGRQTRRRPLGALGARRRGRHRDPDGRVVQRWSSASTTTTATVSTEEVATQKKRDQSVASSTGCRRRSR